MDAADAGAADAGGGAGVEAGGPDGTGVETGADDWA